METAFQRRFCKATVCELQKRRTDSKKSPRIRLEVLTWGLPIVLLIIPMTQCYCKQGKALIRALDAGSSGFHRSAVRLQAGHECWAQYVWAESAENLENAVQNRSFVCALTNLSPSSQIGFKLLGMDSKRLSSTRRTSRITFWSHFDHSVPCDIWDCCVPMCAPHLHIKAFRDFNLPSSSGKDSNLVPEKKRKSLKSS